jgi:hypothetical protein
VGKHYQIEHAYCEPRPDPLPPIMVGGSGERYLLRVVAQHADWWNYIFTDRESLRPQTKCAQIEHCRAVGRDYEEIEQMTVNGVLIGENEQDLKRLLADPNIRPVATILIVGTPDQVTEQLLVAVEQGASMVTVHFMTCRGRMERCCSRRKCCRICGMREVAVVVERYTFRAAPACCPEGDRYASRLAPWLWEKLIDQNGVAVRILQSTCAGPVPSGSVSVAISIPDATSWLRISRTSVKSVTAVLILAQAGIEGQNVAFKHALKESDDGCAIDHDQIAFAVSAGFDKTQFFVERLRNAKIANR